jgi:hypothetical protein
MLSVRHTGILNFMEKVMRHFLLLLVIIGSYLSSGCSSITPVGGAQYSPTDLKQVEVLYQEPQRPYEVIALISHEAATRFATVPGVIQKCRELALKQARLESSIIVDPGASRIITDKKNYS